MPRGGGASATTHSRCSCAPSVCQQAASAAYHWKESLPPPLGATASACRLSGPRPLGGMTHDRQTQGLLRSRPAPRRDAPATNPAGQGPPPRHIADRQDLDERLDAARAVHVRHARRTGGRARAGRLVDRGRQPEVRFQRRARRRNSHCVRPQRRRLVVCGHRLPGHSGQPADHESRLSRRRHGGARIRPRHRTRARASESRRRNSVERAGGHRERWPNRPISGTKTRPGTTCCESTA